MNYRLIVTTPQWHLSGVNTFVLGLARGLARRGVETTVLVTQPGPAKQPTMVPPNDIRVLELPLASRVPWRERWSALLRELRREPAVFLPNYDFDTGLAGAWAPSTTRVVTILHSDESAYYRYLARVRTRVDAVVGVSQTITSRARRIAGDGPLIRTIPYGIHREKPRPGARAQATPIRLTYVGRLVDHQKRSTELAAIASALRARRVPFTMTIVGDGPDAQRLRNSIDEANLTSVVALAGQLPHERIAAVFDEADVLVLNSNYEGMPLALIEAMAHGVVPVASRIASGVPELVTDHVTGLVVDPGDIEGFANAVAELHEHRPLLSALSAAARARASEPAYDEAQMVQEYASLFEACWELPSPRRWPHASSMALPIHVDPEMPLAVPDFAVRVTRTARRALRAVWTKATTKTGERR